MALRPRVAAEVGGGAETSCVPSRVWGVNDAELEVQVVRLDAGLPVPSYAHPGDAGADLSAAADVEIPPGGRALVELSEPLGGGPDVMDPELLPVEYDDAAIAEYMREVGWFSGEGSEDD